MNGILSPFIIQNQMVAHFINTNCRKLTAPHCQFRGVGQSIRQTYLYLWYPLFQVQWDKCDQQNHQITKPRII